jgi:8-oxo-dGTP pyrophosphatase MutT (NUDIX family)
MSTSADGWTHCDLGHRHWGLVGAAGLLVAHAGADGVTRILLQHRSAAVQHGLTWGIPGGALEHGESPETGAFREAREELSGVPDDLVPADQVIDDHGGWSYTTVIARTTHRFPPGTHGWETGEEGYAWVTFDEADDLPLHPGFGASWPRVRDRLD